MRAVELNGAAVEMNKTAFGWGRLAAIDMPAVIEAAGIVRNAPTTAEATAHVLPMLARDRQRSARIRPVATRRRPAQRGRTAPRAGQCRQRCRLPAAGRCTAVAFAGRSHRAPRRLPHRVPERELREALLGLRRQGARGRSREGAGQHRPVGGGGPLLLQADGLQGRIRSRAPVHQRRLQAPPAAAVRRRLLAALPPRTAAAGEEEREGRAAEARIRAVGLSRVPGCWRNCVACAARRWTCSATPPNVVASAA